MEEGQKIIENKLNNIIENPFAKMGKSFIEDKMKSYNIDQTSLLNKYIFNETLKSYYDVEQSFVLNKLILILCPFLKLKKAT